MQLTSARISNTWPRSSPSTVTTSPRCVYSRAVLRKRVVVLRSGLNSIRLTLRSSASTPKTDDDPMAMRSPARNLGVPEKLLSALMR
eukprot:1155759-Pelagomonas_calceolata.AAC.4